MEMQQTYQSFIPQNAKPKISNIPKWQNILLVISLIVFAGAIASAGIFYVLRVAAKKTNLSYENSIIRAKERFDSGLPVKTLEEFDMRLRAAQEILRGHKAFDQFFAILEQVTLKDVQFTSFSYSDGSPKNSIKLTGRAPDYKTIAEESEQFSNDPDARRYFTDIVFSNLTLDKSDKDNAGLINFDVTMHVDPELLLYSRQIANPNPAPNSGAPILPVDNANNTSARNVKLN